LLRLRALQLAYLLTERQRSEVLNLRWRDLDLRLNRTKFLGETRRDKPA